MRVVKILLVTMAVVLFKNASAGEKINIAISATPNNIVPFYSTDANSQNINRLVHLSLIDFNEKMQFACTACLEYHDEMRGEKQILRFKLRKDLTFTDGGKVTAQNVKNSWEYFAKNEKIKSTFMGAFEAIEDIVIKDQYNLEIIYKSFSLENLSNLSLLKILKIKKNSENAVTVADIVGCGEYLLKDVQPLEIILEPRSNTKPTLAFKVVKDETTLALKLINKEIDLSVANMSPRKIFWLKSQRGIKVWDKPSGNFQFMGLNHRRNLFKDIRVRRAFSLLIPRQEILKYKLKNTAILSVGMFSPAFADMYEQRDVEKHDTEEAQKLLSEAGYKKNVEGILERDGKPLEIDWKVSNNKASIEVVEVLKYFLEKEGIIVNVSIQEWGTYMSAFKAGKFDVIIGQWIGFSGPDMLKFVFHSTSVPPKGGNRVGYSNSQVDELIDRATVEKNSMERTKLYKEAEGLVNKDYASINLWHLNVIWIGRDCLSDIQLESTGSFYPLKKLEKHCGK